MPLPSRKRTFKRPRARKIKPETFAQEIKIKEIKSDIEFSNFFEQLLEKTEKLISKSAHKVEKEQTEKTVTEPEPGNSESKNPELKSILTENKISEYLPPIIETLNISSDSEYEVNLSDFIPDDNKIPQNLSPIIEILNISSNSESEVNFSDFTPDKINLSNIEIINISSDSGSETEVEEPSFAQNKNFLPKITNICSLGKNKVRLIKDF